MTLNHMAFYITFLALMSQLLVPVQNQLGSALNDLETLAVPATDQRLSQAMEVMRQDAAQASAIAVGAAEGGSTLQLGAITWSVADGLLLRNDENHAAVHGWHLESDDEGVLVRFETALPRQVWIAHAPE